MPFTSNDPTASSAPVLDRQSLRPDCSNCFALCCTALGFSRTSDFAIDKPAGTPCKNLDTGFSCTIHDSLRPRGFRGCTVFDCFGAGQNVSQNLFQGVSWKAEPATSKDMFQTFKIVRQLHEMLWYLAEAAGRTFDPDTSHQVNDLRRAIEKAMGGVQQTLSLDLGSTHERVRSILMSVSEEVRSAYLATGDDHLDSWLVPGADLMGKTMKSRSLCGADLRGAYLIAADLRGCNLSGADLLGADLRDARLEGADLSKSLYLTQAQLNAAHGDGCTRLPPELDIPAHWPSNS
ncbi:pentapeptide repeat-containing protein [Arthrobacter sp. zg-Y20]|uniref:pentapeptide repeat-containing protein n=1 Tax=unclassified Arthrobacter TaxID=235627 RepID=UPI001D14B8F9|nr:MULTISPECIES: pentapeptide repeat-containing protein [unclassified Arthrobacter]MCC3276230.1 pentapeptide repeat-containing protein [Arthrobacter sp. zg-Y20]MDK1316390.1 pentapeptide repeat-containing protein [Arthrobacter sp. zg.Y20]WIB06437.1 pentapeptide repeat-containing protein [Arthrobacter sp. zg-Y20]